MNTTSPKRGTETSHSFKILFSPSQRSPRQKDVQHLRKSELISEVIRLQEDVIKISNFERERIGQELHDDFTQDLAGIACLSKQLEKRLRPQSPALAGLASELTHELGQALSRMRSLSHEMAPYQLFESELVPALQTLVQKIRERTGVACGAVIDNSIQIRDVKTRLHLYRISQEAIQNSIRHGKASQITLKLRRLDNLRCELSIKDNGLGFHRDSPTGGGMGIRLMQYRCRQIAANLSLKNDESDGGAIVQCAFSTCAAEIVNSQ